MKYESLKIEIINLDSSDVIATSADVTTGDIDFGWTETTNGESYNLLALRADGTYETD